MLLDTGATMSIICTKAAPLTKQLPIQELKVLESYNGKESTVPFSQPIQCIVGILIVEASLRIQKLDGHGILGMDILKRLNVIVDLPNQMLAQSQNGEGGVIVPVSHRVSALKVPTSLEKPLWELDIAEITDKYPNMFAKNKLDYGKIQAEVMVEGPDPRPQRQYKYSREAQEGIHSTIDPLKAQGVLIETASICYALFWRLTVDY